jgi:tetratricopeptide (TPR) repeat protein
MRRARALLILLGAAGCAYYNGLYNARGLVDRAESAFRDGRDSVALAAWREAAAKADTVVTRYPRSKWTDDALLVAGVASAFAGNCAHGLERLAQWQRHPNADQRRRERVRVARGACLVRGGNPESALDSLAPVTRGGDETLSQIAAAWAARAALATGRRDSALAFAALARSEALDAELASTAIATQQVDFAEQLLRRRAPEWRALSPFHAPIAALAKSGRVASVDTIIRSALEGRATRVERARLLLEAGAWAEHAGRIEEARLRYDRALELTSDSTISKNAIVQLSLLEIRTASTLEAARSRLDRAKGRLADAPKIQRADSGLRLASRLAVAADSTGASLFLAAEVARDRVGSASLARTLFLRAAREHHTSSLAPKALLAAAQLTPDSARVWRDFVRTRYASSPYARALDGDLTEPTPFEHDDRLLRQTWMRATLADTSSLASQRSRP